MIDKPLQAIGSIHPHKNADHGETVSACYQKTSEQAEPVFTATAVEERLHKQRVEQRNSMSIQEPILLGENRCPNQMHFPCRILGRAPRRIRHTVNLGMIDGDLFCKEAHQIRECRIVVDHRLIERDMPAFDQIPADQLTPWLTKQITEQKRSLFGIFIKQLMHPVQMVDATGLLRIVQPYRSSIKKDDVRRIIRNPADNLLKTIKKIIIGIGKQNPVTLGKL